MRFIVDVCRKDHPDLQIMYGIGGERELTEQHPRPPLRLRRRAPGADRQRRLRPAPERRLGRPARLDLPARKSAARHRHAGRPAADPPPGRSGDRGLAATRPGDLGVARRAPALRLLEADDLGRGRSRRPAGPRASASTTSPRSGSERRRDPARRSSSAASATASSASTTTPTRSTPPLLLIPLLRFLPADDPRVARHGRRDRRRADRARPRPPLQGRGDRRRPLRRGGHVPDLLLLAGLGALGDRRARRGRASSASACSRRPAGSTSTPRSWSPNPAATSATSPRPSPTWR